MTKKVLAIAWMVLAAAVSAWCGDKPIELFPVISDGKWGYMDKAGKLKIPAKYDCAWDFSEGLACVQVGLMRGYINAAGKMVIAPKYALARPFSEGLAAVYVDAQKWGGFVVFNRGSGQWVYIDKTGRVVAKPHRAITAVADEFRGGYAVVCEGPEDRGIWYLIGKDGKVRTNAMRGMGPFSEGLVAVNKDQRNPRWGYIDAAKKTVIELQYAGARPFSEGLAAIAVPEEKPAPEEGKKKKRGPVPVKWGYINKTGEVVVEPQYKDAREFAAGLAAVKTKEGKWGCIDKMGKVVIQPQFDFVGPFSEGLARIVSGGKHGYMDKTGKVVIEPTFDVGWEFSRGLARVAVGGKEGYIDKSGEYVWEPRGHARGHGGQ